MDHKTRPAGSMTDRGTLAVLLLSAVVAFAFQGSRHLWDPDEGRYTDVAHHMVESGDWLVPRLEPQRPHLTKPPLAYWAIAAGFGTLGGNEWAARLPNALAFIATALLVLGIARRLALPAPEFAAGVWATAWGPAVAANVVTTDTLLAAFETLALYGFVFSGLVGSSAPPRRSGLRLMWLGFGLAFLTKGPPGLLPLAAIVAFTAWQRRSQLPRLFDPLGLLLFTGVGFSWYLVVIWRAPHLLDYFLVHEVVGRIATGQHRRNAGWFGWLTVYGPTLLFGCLPWAVCAAWAWRARRRSHESAPALAAETRRFLLLWIAVPLIVFVLSQSRLPLYVLPLFVPLTLLLAAFMGHWPGAGRPVRVALVTAAAVVVALKLAGTFVHTDTDAHALAADLAAVADLADVDDIVFVDAQARYGLKHYLGLNVVEAEYGTGDVGGPAYAPAMRLCDLLRAPQRLLLLVPEKRLAPFASELAACRARAQQVGSLRKWAIFRRQPPPP